MSTTYSATATKDKDSKDKDSTETSTYVRSSDTTSDSTTTGKNATGGKNKSSTNTDDKHDQDTTSSSQYRSSGTTGQYGSNTTGSSNQYGQDHSSSMMQQQRGGSSNLSQQEVQHKLKEVGNLLQRAGHLLQDLQGSSSNDFQSSSWNSSSRGMGGNFSGPYDQSSGQGHLGQSWNNRFDSDRSERSQYGQPSGRFQDFDRDEMRGFSGRGGMSGRQEDRFEVSRQGPQERSSYDRFSGFGGPNRPDMAYGQQYGQRGNFHGEVRHGSEMESSGRRGGDRW